MSLFTNDISSLSNMFWWSWQLFLMPIKLASILYILSYKMDCLECVLVGFFIQLIVLAPFGTYFSKKQTKLHKKISKIKDKRMKLLSEMFNSMTVIKMLSFTFLSTVRVWQVTNASFVLFCFVSILLDC